MSDNATENDVKNLFTDPSCGSIVKIDKEVANSWFVTFDTEEHARSAALQAMKKEIDGKKVHARLRTETLVLNSSLSYIPPAPAAEQPSDPYYYNQYYYGYDLNIPAEGVDATSFLPENIRKNAMSNNNNNYRGRDGGRNRKKYLIIYYNSDKGRDKRGGGKGRNDKGRQRRNNGSGRNDDHWRQQSNTPPKTNEIPSV